MIDKTVAHSNTVRLETGCGNLYATYVFDEKGRIKNILPNLGKNGTCVNIFLSVICEALTLIMQLPEKTRVEFFTKMTGHHCQFKDFTCADRLIRDLMHIDLKGGHQE